MRRPVSIVIIEHNTTVSRAIVECLELYRDRVTVAGSAQYFSDGVRTVEKAAPDVVLLGVHDVRKGIEEIQWIGAKFPRVPVIACACEKNSDQILSLITAGAIGYLTYPMVQKRFKVILQKLERLIFAVPVTEQAPDGDVIAVYSPIGGVGTTTVAVNLAAALAADGSRVALIDLNLYAGDVDAFLKINPPYTLSDLTDRVGCLDDELVSDIMTRHPSGPYVLTMPLGVDEMLAITAHQIHLTLKSLRSFFRYIVVDCIGQLTSCNLEIFRSSRHILLTTTLALPALKNTSRYFTCMKKKGFRDDRVKLVINRYAPEHGITLNDAELILNNCTFQVIHDSEADALASFAQGVPLVNCLPFSPISKDISELSRRLRQ